MVKIGIHLRKLLHN